MNAEELEIDPRPTDEEAAAIAAALAILRQRAEATRDDATPTRSRWREAGRREMLRDECFDR